MIKSCIWFFIMAGEAIDSDSAKKVMSEYFPTLKRLRKTIY